MTWLVSLVLGWFSSWLDGLFVGLALTSCPSLTSVSLILVAELLSELRQRTGMIQCSRVQACLGIRSFLGFQFIGLYQLDDCPEKSQVQPSLLDARDFCMKLLTLAPNVIEVLCVVSIRLTGVW